MTDPLVPSTDLYIKSLERENEYNNQLISRIGDLVDEGIYTSSVRAAHKIFKGIGVMIGLNMEDAIEEGDSWDDLDGDDDDTLGEDIYD